MMLPMLSRMVLTALTSFFALSLTDVRAWESAPARDISHGEPIFSIWPAIDLREFNSNQRILRRVRYQGHNYFNEVAIVAPDGGVYLQLIHIQNHDLALNLSTRAARYLYLRVGSSYRDQNRQRISFDGIKRVLYRIPRPRSVQTAVRTSVEGGIVYRETTEVSTRPNFVEIEIVLKRRLGDPMGAIEFLERTAFRDAVVGVYHQSKVIRKSEAFPEGGATYWNEAVPLDLPWRIDGQDRSTPAMSETVFDQLIPLNSVQPPRLRPVLLQYAEALTDRELPDPRVYQLEFSFLDARLVDGSVIKWLLRERDLYPFRRMADQPGPVVKRSFGNRAVASLFRRCRLL